MLRKIEKLLDTQIRPALKSHGGDIELIDIDNKKLFIKLTGGCQGCSSAMTTVRDGIAKSVQTKFPQINEIIDITDHENGEKPYM